MAVTLTITLAKALKLKNRLAGRVAKLTTDIQQHNSKQQGADTVDVPALYARRSEAVARLVDLKAAISQANRPIQRDIYALAEKKAEIAMLAGLDAQHGSFMEGHGTTPTVYVAQVRKAEVDTRTLALETDIDALQDKLDGFNHDTRLAIDPGILAAAGD